MSRSYRERPCLLTSDLVPCSSSYLVVSASFETSESLNPDYELQHSIHRSLRHAHSWEQEQTYKSKREREWEGEREREREWPRNDARRTAAKRLCPARARAAVLATNESPTLARKRENQC